MGTRPGVLDALRDLCASLPDGCNVLEIGSWTGESAEAIFGVISPRGGRLVCIDPMWFDIRDYVVSGARDPAGKDPPPRQLETVRAFYERRRLNSDDVILMIARSEDAARYFRDGCFDLIFIDGDHRYEFVRRDIDLWWPKLRIGGIMCGDDYECADWDENYIDHDYFKDRHHGVIKAVSESFGDVAMDGALGWVVRKIRKP